MKKIHFTIITTIIISFNCFAQPSFTWAKQMGGTGLEGANTLAVDNNGDVITTGNFTGAVDFDPGPGTFTMAGLGVSTDVFLSKLDANGNFVWARQIGGTQLDQGFSVTVDNTNNIYFSGSFSNVVDFDPGPGAYTLSASGTTQDAFVCKFDASGNFVWARSFGGTGTDWGLSVKTDASGNTILGGFFQNTVDFDPGPATFTMNGGFQNGFVCKLDATGNFVWAKQFTGVSETSAIVLDASGNIYSGGFFQNTGDFDPGPGTFTFTAFGSSDSFVSKLDAAGNFVWARQLGGTGNDITEGINLDALGNIYTTGQFTGTGDFNPGTGVFNLSAPGSSPDAYISKLDNSGNFVWAVKLGNTGSETAYSIQFDASGSSLTSGYFNGSVDFDPGPGSYSLTSAGNSDIFVWKLDASGNFAAAARIGGTQTDNCIGTAMDAAGNYYMTGLFSNTNDFDMGAGTFNLTSFGSYDIYTAKYNSCAAPSQPGVINGLASICGASSIQNYSVAAISGATSYSWTLPGAGWSGSSTTNSISLTTSSVSGNISVTASNACGASAASVLNVTVNATPTISVNNGTICSGQNFVMIPSGASTYTFSSGTATVSPASTTNYSVTGTSMAGCIGSNTAVSNVVVNTTPTISVNNGTICSGQNFVIVPSGASTYSFSSGSATVSPASTTNYSVTGTSATGCVGSNTAVSNVVVNTTPTISVNSGSICSGSSFTIIPSGASTYTIQGGSSVVSPGSNATYTVNGTSSVGCVAAGTATSSVMVVSTPTANAGLSQTITCISSNVNLTGSGVSSYTWTGPGIVSGGNTSSPLVNMAGTYSLVGSTTGCNSNTATVIVSTNTVAPFVSIGPSTTTICSGSSVTLTASGANTYTWSTSSNSTSIVVAPGSSQTYTVTGTNAINGCSASSSQAIAVNTTPTISVTGGAICPGNSFTINPIGASSYTYSGGSQVVSPGSTTSYTIDGASAAGCMAAPAIITVTVAGTLTLTISGANSICDGSAVILTAGGATTYTWNTGATTTSISPTPSVNTTYSIIGSSGSCTNTAVFNVSVNPLPTVSANTSASIICGPPFQGTATITASGALTYTWNTAATTTSIAVSPSITTNYTVTGTDTNGCENSTTFTQSVSTCSGVGQISIVTPEINVYPNPFHNKITLVTNGTHYPFQIFNALGSLIYQSVSEEENTEINLNDQSTGVYFIRIGLITKKIIKN